MAVAVKLGRKPVVEDARVPYMRTMLAAQPLPPPPPAVNWYAGVQWPMLGNDQAGDCVEAAIMHAIGSLTSYAGAQVEITTDETLQFYSEVTGYNPLDPSTDEGTVVLGIGGAMEFWVSEGVQIGDDLHYATGYMQLHLDGSLDAVRQAIHYFGGLLVGVQLPASIVAGDTVPYMWSDPSGPVAGGHEIWICGYEQDAGSYYYDFVSWGQRCRMSEAFFKAVTVEAVAVYDKDSINARGLNPDGFDVAALVKAMTAIKAAA